MSSDSNKYTFDELKEQYPFLENINFGKIYKEFNDERSYDDNAKEKCQQIKDKLTFSFGEDEIAYKFCNIIYKIIVTIKNIQSDHFEGIREDDKSYCIYLKYWLYDQVESIGAIHVPIDKAFETVQNDIRTEIQNVVSNPCTFNAMKWSQYYKLKSLYAFILFYYKNINDIYTKKDVPYEYLNFLGEGLKAYHESIYDCSSEQKDEIYCNEFNELKEIFKLDKLYSEKLTHNTEYNYSAESNDNCPLVIESLKNPILISYKEKNNIFYLSNQPIDFQKSTILTTSSAIGTTVGISAFLLYLYKHTSLGSLFRHRIKKSNIIFDNINTEAHNFTLPTSEIENAHFENSDYNISYYSLKNS
ncbi:PIR Superfamily Protein [Plasmodium ovale curtisi]|uniref:PIR Superfamily Protein n=1 Tax=Plasmodium ovale curtisi TaxID=864141 RepID=A0A1A8VK38_PLAOA|nr:PIR Superfamily Protein [Plasmodium ovale curtisi]